MMRKRYFISLILATSFFTTGYSAKGVYCPIDPNRPHVAGMETIVQHYLESVDRGELVTFNRKLDRSEIIPVRVEYSYQIASGSVEIKVYSDLKEPLAVPNQPDVEIRSVCSIVEDGKIVGTESHIWIK